MAQKALWAKTIYMNVTAQIFVNYLKQWRATYYGKDAPRLKEEKKGRLFRDNLPLGGYVTIDIRNPATAPPLGVTFATFHAPFESSTTGYSDSDLLFAKFAEGGVVPPRPRLADYATDMVEHAIVWWGDATRIMKVNIEREEDEPAPSAALPTDPPVPGTNGYTWDDVFDWFYRGGQSYGYPTIKDLAGDILRVAKTIYNNHGPYTARYGRRPMPDNESKFAGMTAIVKKVHDDE